MSAVPNGDGDESELASFSVRLPSDMGGDGWRVDVSEAQPVTIDWFDGDVGIHLTRNCTGRFEVEVNVLNPDHVSDAFEKLMKVISEQIGDFNDVNMRMEVTYY